MQLSIQLVAFVLLRQSPWPCCLQHVRAAKFIRTIWNHYSLSRSAFHHLQAVATESWVGAWEQNYSLSTECKLESCLPMFIPKKRSPNKFCCGGISSICSCYVNYVMCNLWSLPHRVYVETIEILFAKNCRTYEIWGWKMVSGSNLLASNLTIFFLGEHAPRHTYYMRYIDFSHTTLKYSLLQPCCVSSSGKFLQLWGSLLVKWPTVVALAWITITVI